jgi:hypothetical protein
MLTFAWLVHDRHQHLVATPRLAGCKSQHDRLEAADLTRCDDLKNCSPRASVAGNAGATYTY